MYHLGDIIFQLLVILIPVGLIFFIVYYVRSVKNRNRRMDELEAKVEKLGNKKD